MNTFSLFAIAAILWGSTVNPSLTAANHDPNAARAAQQQGGSIFPGLPEGAGGNQWDEDHIFQQMCNPDWNGEIQVGNKQHGRHTNWYSPANLSAAQRQRVEARVREQCHLPVSFYFSEPFYKKWVNGQPVLVPDVNADAAANPQEYYSLYIKLADVTSNIDVPLHNGDLLQAVVALKVEFANALARAKHSKVVMEGARLGVTWAALKMSIHQFCLSVVECDLIAQDLVNMDAGLKRMIARFAAIATRAVQLSQNIDKEFEKLVRDRNQKLIHKNYEELYDFLNEILQFYGVGHQGLGYSEHFELMQFMHQQPAIKKWKVISVAYAVLQELLASNVAPVEKTQSEILDHLLLNKSCHAFAKKVRAANVGDLVETRRLDGKLWNVYRTANNMPSKKTCEALVASLRAQNIRLQGVTPFLVRIPDQGRFAYWIIECGMDQWANLYCIPGNYVGWNAPNTLHQNGLNGWGYYMVPDCPTVELRLAQDGDRTSLYDPLNVHGLPGRSILGTMMESRIHELLTVHNVHRFHELPAGAQQDARGEVERYNQERYQNHLASEHLENSALSVEEQTLPEGVDEGQKAAIAHNRAAKLSSELKDRLTGARVSRLRTHGSDLTENPGRLLAMRVHELFDPNHLHNTHNLNSREREFYGENHEGGYVDTVENTIAQQQQAMPEGVSTADRLNDLFSEENIHSRLHASYNIHEGAPYNVSAQSAADADQYYDVHEALANYDQAEEDPVSLDRARQRQISPTRIPAPIFPVGNPRQANQ